MKKFCLLLCCCFFGITLNGFTQSTTPPVHSKAAIRTVIVQFRNADFQKKSTEIVSNLKGITGITYLGHCDTRALYVVSVDTHVTGLDVEKIIQSKIPAGLAYDFKEGTLEQVIGTFSSCLIQETL